MGIQYPWVNLRTGVCSLFTNINRNILIQYTKGMLQLKSRLNANHHPAEVILTQQVQAICVKKCLNFCQEMSKFLLRNV